MKTLQKTFFGIIIAATFASAATASTATTLDMLRAMKVSDFIENEYNMIARTDAYIMRTADITPTRGEVQQFFGLGENFWTNFEGEQCVVASSLCVGNAGAGVNLAYDFTRKTYTLSNTLGASPNTFVAQAYASTVDNTRSVNTVNNNVTYPVSSAAANLIDLVTELASEPTAHVGTTAPGDTTKTWYEPDGQGGLTVRKYNTATGQWDRIGSTASAGKGKIYTETKEELDKIPCIAGDEGYTHDDEVAMEYTCIADGTWRLTGGGGGDAGLFNGDATIEQIAKQLMTKDGGSVATASAPFGEYAGPKEFTKKSAVGSNGYWVATDNMHVVADKLASLRTQSWALNAYGWLPKSSGSVYTLQRRNVTGVGVRWTYIADGYNDVVGNFDNIELDEGGFVYDKKNNKYFRKTPGTNVWVSLDSVATNVVELTRGPLGRGEFTSVNANRTYYVGFNDCTTTTCNGTGGTYAGALFDTMYVFYRSTAGNRKNNLIDAVPRANMAQIYSNADAAALFGGFVYLRATDNRGRPCYHRAGTTTYVTANNVVIPTGNNLPNVDNATCATASYSGSALALTNRTQMSNWTDAPASAQVNTAGRTYTKVNNGTTFGFWQATDEWVTAGSRSDFNNAANNTIVYLSKQVGSEARYTSAGVTATADNTFKQWFYSTTGTRTRNMLDGRIASEYYADSNAGAHLVNPTNGRRFTDNKVWGNYTTYKNLSGTALYNTLASKPQYDRSICRYSCRCENGTFYYRYWNNSSYEDRTLTNWLGGSLTSVWDFAPHYVEPCTWTQVGWVSVIGEFRFPYSD